MQLQLYKDSNRSINFMGMPSGDFVDHIPPGVYNYIVSESMAGTSFKLAYLGETLPVPEVRYGEHAEMIKAATEGYDRLNPSYGILMFGNKGAGKTVLGNDIANTIGKGGIPTVLIREQTRADHIRVLIASIGPCVVYFDEFGKNYGEAAREELLPVFSDMSYRGVVFILTGNETEEFSSYFFDRPGRFLHRFVFGKLTSTALLDYFKKNNIDAKKLVWLYSVRDRLTFDVLNAIKNPLRLANTFPEFKNKVKWLNVPTPHQLELIVKSVGLVLDNKIHDLTFAGGTTDGETVEITATDETGAEIVERFPLQQRNGMLTFTSGCAFESGPLYLIISVGHRDHGEQFMDKNGLFAKRLTERSGTKTVPSHIDETSEIPHDPFVRREMVKPEASRSRLLENAGSTGMIEAGGAIVRYFSNPVMVEGGFTIEGNSPPGG